MSSPQLQLFSSGSEADRWTIRISGRARRLSVRVYPGGRVEVVVAPGASPASVQKFVGMHRQWIRRRIEDLSTAAGASEQGRPAAIQLPAIGRNYAVEYEHGFGPARAQVAGSELLCVRGALHGDDVVAGALRDWLLLLARDELGRALAGVAAEGDFCYSRLQIRRQRTRWGSCSDGHDQLLLSRPRR